MVQTKLWVTGSIGEQNAMMPLKGGKAVQLAEQPRPVVFDNSLPIKGAFHVGCPPLPRVATAYE